MFRVMGGKINIFGRWVATMPGSHTISIDKGTGSTYTDSQSGTPVVSYNLDDGTGHITLSSLMSNPGKAGNQPVVSLDWRGQSIISRGPLYTEGTGAGGDEITVYLEGFVFSFNYYALANVVCARKPFRWTGGRVCFSSMLSPGSVADAGRYTAIPAAMSCGGAGWDTFSSQSAVTPPSMGNTAFFNGLQRDALEFYGNSVSIVFSYRTHRKYLFFASNVDGLFSTPFGAIGGSASGSPANGTLPDINGVEFMFSMFNLRQ